MQQRTVIWKTSDRVLQRHLHQGEADPFMYLDFSLTLASLRANVGKTRAKRADVPSGHNLKGLSRLGLNCLPTVPTLGLKMH